jgi:hypothetical protein
MAGGVEPVRFDLTVEDEVDDLSAVGAVDGLAIEELYGSWEASRILEVCYACVLPGGASSWLASSSPSASMVPVPFFFVFVTAADAAAKMEDERLSESESAAWTEEVTPPLCLVPPYVTEADLSCFRAVGVPAPGTGEILKVSDFLAGGTRQRGSGVVTAAVASMPSSSPEDAVEKDVVLVAEVVECFVSLPAAVEVRVLSIVADGAATDGQGADVADVVDVAVVVVVSTVVEEFGILSPLSSPASCGALVEEIFVSFLQWGLLSCPS